MKALHGTGVALVTPFNTDGSVDYEGLSQLVEHVIKGGLDYLVVLGTTAETATLSIEEQKSVLNHVKQINDSRKPIVIGIGGNSTAAIIEAYQDFNLDGVAAVLTASPYYNKPTQEGIYQHYKAIAEATEMPILLYNVPGRTASNMTAETTIRLAHDFKNIVGIKEASGNMEQVMQIIKDKPTDFFVTSGDDALALPITLLGGVGVISVVANAYPALFSEMIRAAKAGNLALANINHYKLLDFAGLIFEEGNPGGVKSALKHLKVCGDNLRLPLWKVSKGLDEKLKKEVAKIGLVNFKLYWY